MFRVSVDIGGTFTDLVAFDEESGRVYSLKALTVPRRPEEGVSQCLRLFQRVSDTGSIGFIGHATTIATNALLGQMELELPRAALVTTQGFRDIIEIGRQRRSQVYNLFFKRPRPLVRRRHRFEVEERVSAAGEVSKELTEGEVERVLGDLAEAGVETVAVGLLNSYANPVHEDVLKEAIESRLGLYVSASHDVSNEYREYERLSTTVVNACLLPIMGRYLEALQGRLDSLGVGAPLYVMQSNGGLAYAQVARSKPVTLVESGPAAGVIAASWLGKQLGLKDVISFDMGGTTAKAGLVRGGRSEMVHEYEVAGEVHMGRVVKGSGYPVRLPFIDLAECSAGGGTVARAVNGVLRVGPVSAGSDPGPACYGRGGTDFTITDANMLLGRLDPAALLDGEMKVYKNLAEEACRALADELGMEGLEVAEGVIRIANSTMAKILRIVSVERGVDPRGFALVAFGGAGPMHCCPLAEELGIRQIVIPPNPGVFSALGLLTADLSHDYSTPVLSVLDELDAELAEDAYREMESQGRETLESEGVEPSKQRFQRMADVRYSGQGYELTVEVGRPFQEASKMELREGFNTLHQEVYGFCDEEEVVEVVNLRVRAVGLLESPRLKRVEGGGAPEPLGEREAYFEGGGWVSTPVYHREGLRGRGMGPAIIQQYDSTTVVYPGWGFQVDGFGNLVLRRGVEW